MPGRRDYLPPLLAFLAATGVAVVCALVAGHDPAKTVTWYRWDSFHYVHIALDGYTDTQRACPGSAITCAHAGWLPGYAVLIALPAQLGMPARTAALAISWAFCLATLIVLWRRFPRPETREAQVAFLLFAAFTPGWIYMHAIFPLSLLTFLALLTLLFLERGRWRAGGLSAAAAAATYPLGVLLAPLATLWLALDGPRQRLRERLPRATLTGAMVLGGFAAALLASALWTGDLLGYFHAQKHPLRDPVSGMLDEISSAFEPERGRLERARAAQVLLTAAVAATVALLLVRRRGRLSRLDVIAGAFALAVWLLPLTQIGVSVYRSNAALLPAAPLLRHLGVAARWALTVAAVLIGAPMAVLFFQGRLV